MRVALYRYVSLVVSCLPWLCGCVSDVGSSRSDAYASSSDAIIVIPSDGGREPLVRLTEAEAGAPVPAIDAPITADTVAVNPCGNSIVEDGETCDDGNARSGDGCDGTCKKEPGHTCSVPGQPCILDLFCGDGLPGPDESCDDRNSNDGDGCSSRCTIEENFRCPVFGQLCEPTVLPPACGNGVTEYGESCDDENIKALDGCSEICRTEKGWSCVGRVCTKLATCGNGEVDPGEQCDDGNLKPGDCCGATCRLESNCKCTPPSADAGAPGQICVSTIVCGDMVAAGGEVCDDGNTRAGDGCSADCTKVESGFNCPNTGGACKPATVPCPNAKLDPGEDCDDANSKSGDGCSANCKVEPGFVCPTVGAPCRLMEFCGDGVVSYTLGETCDDKNTAPSDGCSATCKIEAGYNCDNSVLPSVCKPEACGNKKIAAGETCDDGNITSGDGCSSSCQLESGFTCPVIGAACRAICGDKLIRGHERCDDGNTDDKDGCSAQCQLEPGYICDTAGVCTKTICGDSVKQGTEQCDDTLPNATDKPYDGCYHCMLEPKCGTATSPVGSCASVCGDGLLVTSGGEQCDDGNTVNGDGCSSTCQIEPGFKCTSVTEAPPSSITLPIVYRDLLGITDSTGKTVADGHPDFEKASADRNPRMAGIVQNLLDVNRKVVYAGTDTAPIATTTGKTRFDQWYRDVAGVNQRIDQTLTLTRDTNGAYVMNSAVDQPWKGRGGFFPLDGIGLGNQGRTHNYHFTSEMRYWFEYKGGETLKFSGDDDVWVFINGHLVVDIGGVHWPTFGLVVLGSNGHGASCIEANNNLDATPGTTCTPDTDTNLEMEIGKIYEVVVFQAERHTNDSNYWLTLTNFLTGKSTCKSDCGDGIVTPDEACDLGKTSNTGAYGGCTANCTLGPYCGDGIKNGSEPCDDGVNSNVYGSATSGCAPGCRIAPNCGDGTIDVSYGETCDKGANNSATAYGPGACNDKCRTAGFCGDGLVNGTEACDEGQNNGTLTSKCDTKCAIKCGNGTLDDGEQCDLGAGKNTGAYGGCKADCTKAPYCGDGFKQAALGEECDDGKNDGSYGTCAKTCKLAPHCGNGTSEKDNGEVCDQGQANQVNPYGPALCTATCRPAPFCGDHSVDAAFGETCDDGVNNIDTLPGACRTDCSGYNPPPITCGNGKVEAGETCDDGVLNGTATSLCDGRCQFKCGNGIKDAGEQCDDGINDGSYGTCRPDCTFAPYCGDGVKDLNEQCDLGATNNANAYGPNQCTNLCAIAPFCGDLRVNGTEKCDGQIYCTGVCTIAGPIP